jgi:hypothetical protein
MRYHAFAHRAFPEKVWNPPLRRTALRPAPAV